MTEQITVKEIEKKARKAARQDGIATIIAGFALALLSPFFLDDRFGVMLILGTGLYVFLPEIIRRRYVYPRVGYVKVTKEKGKKFKLMISTLVLLIFVVILKVSAYNWILPFYLALVFGLMAFTIAYVYRTVSELFLGGLILVSGIVGLVATLQGNEPGMVAALQLCVLGAVFVLVGSVQFVWFIRSHAIAGEHINETIS
ncbi:MAG: hypothetical protein JSV98_10805 [candidate division WOR-3 bacterium]|nr:MAG: hypothetical protein JSV98_10805 [candidate division WOR-3 bacterium]